MAKTRTTKRPAKKSKFVTGDEGWDKNNADGELLVQLLTNGDIKQSDTPAMIHQNYPQFHKYGKDSFRAAVTRAKTETGFAIRSPDDVAVESDNSSDTSADGEGK